MADHVGSWLNFAQRSRDEGGLGLAPHQASGLVGNLMQESGRDLNPWGPTGDNGTAWGTAQWRGDRLTGLQKYAADNGLDHRSPEAQQGWMRREFDGPENRAYQALLATTTPEEAATAVNRRYERSADTSGQREANARKLMAQFGGGSGGSTPALAYDRTGAHVADNSNDAPALSTRATLGPGVLVPGVYRGASGPQDQPYDWRSRITQAAAALSGVSDPEQAKALLAGNAQVAKDTGSYSLGPIDPQTGVGLRIHNKTGQVTTFQAQKPKEDEAEKAYRTDQAKKFSDLNTSIAADADKARSALGNIDTLRSALSDPNVYQGSNGETVAKLKNFGSSVLGLDLSGVENTQVAQALINKMVQESRTLNGGMPGSLSDKDLDFLKNANVALTKDPAANQRILDIYEKLHKTAIERNADRVAYTKGGKMLDDDFNTSQAAKYAQRKASQDAADAKAPAAAAAAPSTPKPVIKTKTGVTWSLN